MNLFTNRFTVAVRPDGTAEITFQYVRATDAETITLETLVLVHEDLAALANAISDGLEQYAEKKKGAN